MQDVEVVGLHDHVVEFEERQALFPAFFVAFGRQHAVDTEMDAHFAEHLDVIQAQEPVGVVDHEGLAVGKVDKAGHLLPEAVDVVLNEFRGQHLAHGILARRIANHARAAAQEGDGTMAGALHVGHGHEGDKVADVQAVRRGIEADIKRDLFFFEQLTDFVFVRQLRDKAAFF